MIRSGPLTQALVWLHVPALFLASRHRRRRMKDMPQTPRPSPSRPTLHFALLVAFVLTGELSGGQAPITAAEYAARRDSLAARIGDGVIVAFGGRTPVSDFGPFYQLPAFRYLTGYLFAEATLVTVARGGRGTSTLFVSRTATRRALYYGEEPDSAAIATDSDP